MKTKRVRRRVGPLVNHVTAHRLAYPVDGEVPRLTLVGWRPGRVARVQRRSLVAILITASTFVVFWMRPVPAPRAAVWAVALTAAGVGLTAAFVRLVGRQPPEVLIALLLTDRRALVATTTWFGRASVLELDASAMRSATIQTKTYASVQFGRLPIPRVVFAGDAGVVLELEMHKVATEMLAKLLAEARLDVAEETSGKRSVT